jgi:hypothetical protein
MHSAVLIPVCSRHGDVGDPQLVRAVPAEAPLRPLPQPTTSETDTVRRLDRLGGLLHEYQQVA